MQFQPGTSIGPYVLRGLLGSGGMGDVYLAHDARLNRDVAIKILPASTAQDPERLRRFEQEARAASALNHPSIVTVYEFGHAEGRAYLCMEVVAGQTLRDVLTENPLPLRRALAIAAQLADGLAKAHEAGIVHRDLKPENVMVTPDGFAKILDFGLAKLVETAQHNAQTAAGGTDAGTVLGTAGYMSPEQASGRTADTRSDQFSLGAVVYEMVTGRRAFHKPTVVETLSAIVREEVPPVQSLQAATPAPIAWIIERCLAKEPAERYASTRDLARDLANARDRLSELTSGSVTASPERRPPVRLREGIAWATAVFLAVAGGVMVWRSGSNPLPAAERTVRFTFAAPPGVTFTSLLSSAPFAVSPDGTHIVFLAAADGTRSLWLRSIDSLQARPLPGTTGASGPFWSPDGRHVAFFVMGELKRIAIAGGDSMTVAAIGRSNGGGGTWNQDNVIVFAPAVDTGLSRVSATGGTVSPLTTLDIAGEESAHLSPVFLPDGNHFVFRIMGRANSGTYIASLDSPAPRRIADVESMLGYGAGHLFFVRDRALLAWRFDDARNALVGEPIRVAAEIESTAVSSGFAVSARGTVVYWPGSYSISQPTWVSRSGNVLATVGSPGPYGTAALSPDDTQIAIERFDEPSIWRLDMRGGLTRLTRGGMYQSTPVWRPDGQALVYGKVLHTPPNLFVKQLDRDAEDERIFWNRFQVFPQSFSPDGRLLAYTTIDPESGNDIWLMDLGGGEGTGAPSRKPLIVTPFNEGYARISPNGRWLAYAANESGRQNVYLAPLDAPARKQAVSANGGRLPVWSRNGRELFYISDNGAMMAVTVGGDAMPEIGRATSLFDAGIPVGILGSVTPYDVARDGRFLIHRFIERTTPVATVITSWQPPAHTAAVP